jgi:hypothetical protein
VTEERRRQSRIRLSMVLRVRGWNADQTAWEEMAETEDVSSSGAAFLLRRSVALGQVLHLSLALPRRFRQYDLMEPTYTVYAVVRYVGATRVGVSFAGKFPPRGFQENPGGRVPTVDPQHARRYLRHLAMVNVRLKRFSAPPGEATEEVTVTEDVSRGGVLVLTALRASPGETLMLEEVGGDFRTRSTVRSVTVGPDKLPRLGLMFLDDDATTRSVTWLRRIGVPVDGPPPAAAPPAPVASAPAVPVLRSLQITPSVFEECGEGEHAICPTGRAARGEGRFHLCACSCHGVS